MSPSETAESAGEAIHDAGYDCLILVTDGKHVGVFAHGERANLAVMVECAEQIDVENDFPEIPDRVN